jgi:hypothetical protein
MPNTSRISGFRPVKHLNGSPYNGQANIYYVASAADELLVNDVVKHGGSADTNGIPTADLCGATDVPIGIVVGILPAKLDPAGLMSNGSMVLDLPGVTQIAASGAGYILVADSPDIIMEAEADTSATPAAVDVGLNVSHTNTANSLTRTSATVTSPAGVNTTTKATTSTLNFEIMGFVRRPDNEIGASAKLLVGFNRHQYKGVGTTGI